MTVEEWLGEDNVLGCDIWHKKYQYNGESFDEWLDRVSNKNENLRKLIEEKKFIFAGRILANRGITDRKLTYSNCFSGDTRIMTDKGLKSLKELSGTKVNVLSKSSWREAEIKEFGTQVLSELTLKRGKSVRKFLVTPNHLWIVADGQKRKIVETQDLNIGDIIPTEVLKCYRTYKPSPFGVAHGLFMGDGDHVERKTLRMNLCGDKKELLPYFTPDTVGVSGDATTICGMPQFFLRYPELTESTSYLYGWLAGYFAADGSIDERGSCVICSTKKEDLEYVQNVLCVLGIPCESIREQERISNLTGERGIVYILNLNKHYLNENFFVLSKHKERFLEHPPVKKSEWKVDSIIYSDIPAQKVYCAVVPETECFALEGGILTHNCYVISPPDDNIESIFECASKLARTFSYGGGCGIDLSRLRPKGAKTSNAAKESTGPVSFMDIYSQVTGTISQNGRRGALMISIDINHPDVEEFIDCKTDLSKVNYANISVRVNDEFMKAVEEDKDYFLKWPCDFGLLLDAAESIKPDYNTLTPVYGNPDFSKTRELFGYIKKIKARDLFNKLVKNNWDYAEPGILYWDRISGYNLLDNTDFKYAGVNPCAK